jgi:peptide/nickel transport system ATP-binding protein
MSPLLEVNDLTVRFGAHLAVSQLSLSVHKGETVALVGESGCGKSTTALALMRLLPAGAVVSGRISFAGRDLVRLPEPEVRNLRGRQIGLIFQEPMASLNPVMTVGAQLVEALRVDPSISRKAARARAVELLDLVRIPEPAYRFHDYPHNFSGGQRQRILLAMASAHRPRLLIADEPTTAVDAVVQTEILDLLDGLRRELSMGLLLITHDLGMVSGWADRVIVMHYGLKIEEGATDSLFLHPRQSYTRALLGASMSLDRQLHYLTSRLTEVDSSNTAEVSAVTPQSPTVSHVRHLLSVRDLQVTYQSRSKVIRAVDGVSFDIGVGETVGLLGESGCGKSTLAKAILRLVQSSGGQILLDGVDITKEEGPKLRNRRHLMQMIFQDPYSSLNPRQSVFTILDAALTVHGVNDKADRTRRIYDIADHVRLARDSLQRYPHEFSGGQRQRVGIARALILRPSLLICDEPVSALDMSIQAQILNLLVDLKQELNLSYLFISHDLSVVRYMADRVLVMSEGRIVESGDHENIWKSPQHPFTRRLIDAVCVERSRAPAPRPIESDLELAYERQK